MYGLAKVVPTVECVFVAASTSTHLILKGGEDIFIDMGVSSDDASSVSIDGAFALRVLKAINISGISSSIETG